MPITVSIALSVGAAMADSCGADGDDGDGALVGTGAAAWGEDAAAGAAGAAGDVSVEPEAGSDGGADSEHPAQSRPAAARPTKDADRWAKVLRVVMADCTNERQPVCGGYPWFDEPPPCHHAP